jgi:hypothetical protein
MTVYELAAFPTLISLTIVPIISISEDVKSPAISVTSTATLGEGCTGCDADDCHAQSKSD